MGIIEIIKTSYNVVGNVKLNNDPILYIKELDDKKLAIATKKEIYLCKGKNYSISEIIQGTQGCIYMLNLGNNQMIYILWSSENSSEKNLTFFDYKLKKY